MSRELFLVVVRTSWVATCGLCWWRAHRGWSANNNIDLWFWGVFFVIDLMLLGAALQEWSGR